MRPLREDLHPRATRRRLHGEHRGKLRGLLQVLLGRAGLPVAPPSIGAADLLDAMSRDKKVTAKTLRFVLLREIGDAFVTSDYDKAAL